MKRLVSIFAGMFLLTFAILVQTATAQEDAGRLLKQLEDDSDRFSNTVAKALDSSRYDGTEAEDEMTRFVRAFEDSIDRLKEAYEKGNDTLDLAKAVQTRAKAIDKFLKKNADVGGNTMTDWGTVKAVLLRIKATKMIKTT
jgi:hypothetical protein